MINVKDRIPGVGKANRKLVTPEDGGSPFYARIVNADEPQENGTYINRALLMALQGFYGNTTVFNADGSITETNPAGDTKVTVFNVDGSIAETFTSGTMSITKTTTFNADGSISEVIS